MNKQDRQGVRTAPDLERKYKLQDMSDIAKTASNAQMAPTNAQAVANNAASEAASARAIADGMEDRISALEKGDSGGSGADGGYYTPTVTQPTADTMEVSYTPSNESMPSVPTVSVTLPKGEKGDPGDGNDTGLSIVNGLLCITYEVN